MAVASIAARVTELRFLDGIEKVEHVPYPTGDQFWVRFNRPLDFNKLEKIVKNHGYRVIRFASLPSKMPRGLSEMLWDGITHVVVKKISGWSSFTSSLGFEPDGIAKIGVDLHGPYELFIAMNEEGIQILYEYLGLKYVPPPPPPAPPKPTVPAKPTPAAAPPRPAGVQPAGSPSAPASPQPQQPKPGTQQSQQVATTAIAKPAPAAPAQPASPVASPPTESSAGMAPAQAASKPEAKKETDARTSSEGG